MGLGFFVQTNDLKVTPSGIITGAIENKTHQVRTAAELNRDEEIALFNARRQPGGGGVESMVGARASDARTVTGWWLFEKDSEGHSQLDPDANQLSRRVNQRLLTRARKECEQKLNKTDGS